MSTGSVIRLNNLGVVLGGKAVLRRINLEITHGERIAIVGANGAGKSTLLKVISGFMFPNEGSAHVLGHDLNTALKRPDLRSVRSEIGHVFQRLNLVPRLTALENVLIGRLGKNQSLKTWFRIFKKEDMERARSALESVGMSKKAGCRADRLSGGERQKVAIARALAQQAEIILADEPTANLDPQATMEVAKLLSSLSAARRFTLITVLHTPSLFEVLSGRVLGMRQGELVFDTALNGLDQEMLAGLWGQP